jgi:hypothetical protein|uniref:Uncharacterized protein n=1 Tax=Myoviridae sp. ctshb19 TaxID=2825194 RepID=A0A8S5UH58_9CAUD|nr:MAG TPA: hypothetical protein [Myoviridae sp. ctshb19]
MILLNTIEKANSLVAHASDYVAVYSAPTISLYRKTPNTNDLALEKTFELDGVKKLSLSENGQCIVAQTSTQTHRLHMPDDDPLETTGNMAISDNNFLIVLQPTAVQVIRETTVLLTATITAADKVAAGVNSFVVYNTSRALTGTYTGFVLAETAQTKSLLYVAHTGQDKFAYFYSDGSVTLASTTRTLTVLKGHRESGKHVVANDGTDEWVYMRRAPLTQPVKLRPYVPPPIPGAFFVTDPGITYTITSSAGVEIEETPSIGDATLILPSSTTDGVDIIFDQALNLAATDWTLQWSSENTTSGGGSYFAEIALLPAASNLGVVARYGDGGYGNRLQFGGQLSTTTNVWNAPFTKTTLVSVLKRYRLVKQGTTITLYVDDVKQLLAVGTGSTYNVQAFTIDTDITAIKKIRLGATPSGGSTMPAKRGPVQFNLSAILPPVLVVEILSGTKASASPSFSNTNFYAGTNRMILPTTDKIRIVEADMTVTETPVPAALTYPTFYMVDDNFVAIAGVGSTSWLSTNGGKTFASTLTGAQYFGQLFKSQGAIWMPESATTARKYSLTMTGGFTTVTKTSSMISQSYWSASHAATVASTNSSGSTQLYVHRNPNNLTFSPYSSGITTNCSFSYIGSNVFYVRYSTLVKLFYIGAGTTAPVLLADLPKNYTDIMHIGNKFIVVDGATLYAANTTLVDNPDATQAEAQIYANEIAATAGKAPHTIGFSALWATPWKGQNRFMVGDRTNYKIYRIEP